MTMRWRARTWAGEVLAEALDRATLDVSAAEALVRDGHVTAVLVQARTDDSPWFTVEQLGLVGPGVVGVQMCFPTRDADGIEKPNRGSFDDVVVRPKRPVGRPRKPKQQVLPFENLPPPRRGRPRKRLSLDEQRLRRRAEAKQRYDRNKESGPSRSQAAGRVRAFPSDNEEPTPAPAPAGLASDQFAWILRGLYQEQWDDVVNYRYHPYEWLPADGQRQWRDKRHSAKYAPKLNRRHLRHRWWQDALKKTT